MAALDALPALDVRGCLGNVLLLPTPQRCSALALGLERDTALIDYMKQGQHALLQAAGLPVEAREPLPHVTFARPARMAAELKGEGFNAALKAWAETVVLPPIKIRLQALALYTAAEDRSVRRFQILHPKL